MESDSYVNETSLIRADAFNLFTHGSKTGPRRANTGQKSYNSQHNHNPYAKFKLALKVDAQHQKRTGRKQAGKTKLGHPGQQRQILHLISQKAASNSADRYAVTKLKIKIPDLIIIHESQWIYNAVSAKMIYKLNGSIAIEYSSR